RPPTRRGRQPGPGRADPRPDPGPRAGPSLDQRARHDRPDPPGRARPDPDTHLAAGRDHRSRGVTATDLVVVLPGIMASTLAKRGHLVWAPSAGAVLRAIATFGRSVTRLTLPTTSATATPATGSRPAG